MAEDDHAGLHGRPHVLHELAGHIWNQPLAFTVANHQHIVRTGCEQVTELAERDAFLVDDVEPFQIGPIDFAALGLG